MSNNEALIKRLDECRNILMSGDGEWSDAEQMDRTVTEVIEHMAELEAERDALDKTWRDWWASCRKRGAWMPSPPEGIEGLE